MSLEITLQDHGELWAEAEQRLPPIVSADGLEIAYPMPPLLGDGYDRQIEIQPDVELCVFDGIYRQDVVLCIPENRHLVQFVVNLSGTVDSGEFGYRNAYRGYIGGSGIQQPIQTFIPQGQRLTRVNIHMQPQILAQFFGTVEGDLLPILDLLVPEAEQPQRVFSPLTTQAIRAVTQQIMHCRFTGITKRLYLQGKVLELIALQLAGVSSLGSGERALKPEMMAGVQRAAAVLRSNLENPPDQTALARAVGVSDRTLRRGFQQMFGTTVLGYLIEQRLTLAKQLLRETDLSVTEVVHRCGYSNSGHFAAAFKRHFGITPRQCALGMKATQPQ